MANIYLIRHAESIANAQGIYQGQSYDTGLSELGMKQAKALGKRFAAIPLDVMYASPLTRALQTAQGIENGHRTPVESVLESEIMETNHGEWEGKSKQEIAARWPTLYHQWLTEPLEVSFPRGESYQQTIDRATG